MDKLRNTVTKLPLLLIAMMANIIIAGSAFGAVYWTDTSNNPINNNTLDMSAGETRVVRLCADLEAGQTLKAFTFNLTYDTSLTIVDIKKTNDFSVVYINKDYNEAGTTRTIRVTGFDTKGQSGAGIVSFIDITITKAASGTATINVAAIEQFGEDAATQFLPTEIKALTINATDITVGANEIYWTDTNGVRLDAMNLVPGQKMTVRLKAEIATGKTLAAFKVTLPYDTGISIVDVVPSVDTPIPHNPNDVNFPSVNINNDTVAGHITANGFTTKAIDGPAIISFIDVTLEAMSASTEATSNLNIVVNNFGKTENDADLPSASNITFNIAPVTASQTYWVDTANNKLSTITVPQGGSKTIRLIATVPQDKTLGAYKFTLTYDSNLVSVSAVETPNALFPPNNINTSIPGKIIINGFDSIGFKGSEFLSFIDVTMTWKQAGSFTFEINADNYGASATDEFLPTPVPLAVTVAAPLQTTYTVSFAAGANGNIIGSSIQYVAAGGSTSSVTAVPVAGYKFINWTGSITSTDNPLVISGVNSDMSVTANFAPDTNFTVKFIAGENGSITGETEQTVATGGSTTSVKAVANAGYVFVNWTGKDNFVSKENPLIIKNVAENLEFTANFTESGNRTVKFIAGENGSITGNKTQVVPAGNSTEKVEAVANNGFQFLNWIGTDGFVSTDNPLIVASVVKDMNITANFTEAGVNIYTVNFVAEKNGKVSGAAVQTIVEGKSTSEVTAVSNDGYKFVNWTGTDGFSSTDKHLIVTNVMKHMTITANFIEGSVPVYTVTFSADSNGSISVGATTQSIAEGDSTSEVTANPDPGYKFDNWTGTNGYTSAANPLKIPNIKSDMNVTAHFSLKEINPNAPNKPELILPVDGAVDVGFKPELQTGSYSSPSGQPHGWTIWEVATDVGFAEKDLVLKIKTKADSALDFSSLKLQDFIVTEKGKKYYCRAKHVDTLDIASEWSDIISFTTAATNTEYKEGSGVPIGQEVSSEKLSTLFTESERNGALFVKTLVGNSIIGIQGVENVDKVQWLKSLGSTELPVSDLGSNLIFPKGLVTYKLKTKTIGDLVKVKLMIDTDSIPSNAVWYAYNKNVPENWEIVKVTTDPNRKYITYEIQDGGFGDTDGARNGLIVDSIGYTVPKTVPPKPCEDCEGGGGSDTCFINAASYGNSGLILMVMSFISAVSVFFGRKK